MKRDAFASSVMGLILLAFGSGQGAAFSHARVANPYPSFETIQFFPGWRGGPGWRGPWRGPPGWNGRPYWFARPWVRRPYYGTIVAGVALGTLITLAAVGAVPPRPAPGNRGYWDNCY